MKKNQSNQVFRNFVLLMGLFLIVSCNIFNRNSKEVKLSDKKSEDPHVYRIDFSSNKMWEELCREMTKPDGELGFKASLNFISDGKFKDKSPDELKGLMKKDMSYPFDFLFIVDSFSLNHPEKPILFMVFGQEEARVDRFRVLSKDMWIIENNMSTANVSFEELLFSVDEKGIFRTN